MVLVYDKPSNTIGILQTKFRYREGHEARRSGLEAIPLDQYVEGGHGEGEPGAKIRPARLHDFFEMADQRQHRQHDLHQHTVLPLAALTQFEVARIALGRMESGITQDDHASVDLTNQPLKGVIRNIGGGTRPPHNQPPLIEEQTEFAADNPAMIGEAFATDLLRAAALAHGVNQLDAIRVNDAEHRWGGQERPRPVL